MDIERFEIEGKELTLYKTARGAVAADGESGKDAGAESENAMHAGGTLVVLNAFEDEGKGAVDELSKMERMDFDLLCVGNIEWNRDLSPWSCEPIMPGDEPFAGGADEYLRTLTDSILPEAVRRIGGAPAHVGITGYSLAGLFALYAMYRCEAFDRAASMSGSMWFPGFREYCTTHAMVRTPDKIYLSLGDKEARVRNQVLKTVQDNTEALAEYYEGLGLDVTWELNPGNHFRDPALRIAKGIAAII